nr:YicC/YloC family endoribonuclease [Jannaschia pohangensis]
MTGYAARDADGRRWELRSVNARGLDLRLRLPEVPGLEPAARAALSGVVARGNLTLSLRLGEGEGGAVPRLDPDALAAALAVIAEVQAAAEAAGQLLAPQSATDILSVRGVYETRPATDGLTLAELQADLTDLIAAFDADRAREGAGLRQVLADQIAEIADLTERAAHLAEARADHMAETFRAALARLRDAQIDEAKLAQDIAALAIKADITEEIDRLRLHVTAARDLLTTKGPVGRKLDFLTQEFNREANTLCSKANMAEMTTLGLALKAVIDRLREQVQNVE